MRLERFEEFRGFQFSETFQEALRRILERISGLQILKAWLSNAEPLKIKSCRFLPFLAVPDLTDNSGTPNLSKSFVSLRIRPVAGLPLRKMIALLEYAVS